MDFPSPENPGALSQAEVDQFRCTSCLEISLPSSSTMSGCGHSFCHGCVVRMFEATLTSTNGFPPICCADGPPLSVEELHAEGVLSDELVARYKAHAEETGDSNPFYCHVPRCSEYIPCNCRSATEGQCPKCGTNTCSICKNSAHMGDCQVAEVDSTLAAMAHEQGWQKCNHCRRMICKSDGCNHMTCICGRDFCYICGSPWKSCYCAMIDDGRDDQPDIEFRFAKMAEYPVLEHRWQDIEGRYRCYFCLILFLGPMLECMDCQFHACPTCVDIETVDRQMRREMEEVGLTDTTDTFGPAQPQSNQQQQ